MPTTSWRALITSLEKLRRLNEHGFRMGLAGSGEWLIGVRWFENQDSGPGTRWMTACSPCAVQALVMAFASAEDRDGFDPERYLTDDTYRDTFRFRTDLPRLFNIAANGNFVAGSHAVDVRRAQRAGFDVQPATANSYVPSIEAFGLGEQIPPRQMRRGDAVHMDWIEHRGGHAGFAYDVHFDSAGNADAVLVVAANGSGLHPGHDGYYGPGLSVFGNPPSNHPLVARSGPVESVRYTAPSPYFDDAYAETFVTRGTWVTFGPTPPDFSNTRYPHMTPHTTPAHVMCARLNGMVAPPGLCMDAPEHGDAPPPRPPPVHVESARPTEVQRSEVQASPTTVAAQTRETATQAADAPTPGQRMIETRLQALFAHGWLRTDPGEPDGINDGQTQAALREFQQRYLGRSGATGIADSETRAALANRAAHARRGEPPPDAAPAPAPAPATPALAEVAWSTVSTGPSGSVSLIARGTGLDGRTLRVTVTNHDGGAAIGAARELRIEAGGRGALAFDVAEIVRGVPHATTLVVDGHVAGDGIAELATRGPLRIESGELILPPRNGKGLFAPGNLGAYPDPARLAHELRAAGLDWIMLGALPGGPDVTTPHPTARSSLRTLASAFRAEGVEVWIWGWVFPCEAATHANPHPPPPPTGDALRQVIESSIGTIVDAATDPDIAARGVVLDLEGGFARTREEGARMCAEIAGERTGRGTTLGLGLSSFASTRLPLHAMTAAGGFAMPQLYGAEVRSVGQTTHHGVMARDHASWFAEAGWTKLVPTVPVWRQEAPAGEPPYDVTPARLTALMQFLRDNAGASELVSWSAWGLRNIMHDGQLGGSNVDLGRAFLAFT